MRSSTVALFLVGSKIREHDEIAPKRDQPARPFEFMPSFWAHRLESARHNKLGLVPQREQFCLLEGSPKGRKATPSKTLSVQQPVFSGLVKQCKISRACNAPSAPTVCIVRSHLSILSQRTHQEPGQEHHDQCIVGATRDTRGLGKCIDSMAQSHNPIAQACPLYPALLLQLEPYH